ncbi:MAG: hypothetical protein IJ165_10080, partial [Proteobacteria bacterium]|nr:hypothetical protein [Pseudomonadota bacterium]
RSCNPQGVYVIEECPFACEDGRCSNNVATEPVARSLASADLMSHLGAEIVDGGVNFAVYSEHATRMEVLLFESASADMPAMRFPLTKQPSGVWTAFVKGVGAGLHYGYIAFGPNWPYQENFTPGSSLGFLSDCDDDGNRFNPNKLLIDPYAKRLSGDMDGSKGDARTGSSRSSSTWGAAPKSVVTESRYTWSANETTWIANRQKGDAFANHAANDLVYYEVHPKGFSKNAIRLNDLGLTVTAPGTWKGIGEMAPYLKDLGINALELMPVAEKQDSDTYWGYNTINYFAPDMDNSSASRLSGDVIDEFKWMVDQLHQNDIELIIDVVYGQTGEGGIRKTKKPGSDLLDPEYEFDTDTAAIYSFRGLDNSAYYILEDFAGKPRAGYLNQTGVGNQTRANYAPFKRLIFDSMHYWVEEMHVDGFRVDLASILGVREDDIYSDTGAWFSGVATTVIQEIIDDPVLQKYNTRIVAEPWDGSRYGLGGFTKAKNKPGYAWSEWNGRFRDMVKRFVNWDDYTLASTDSVPPAWEQLMNLGNLFTGSSSLFGDDGRAPYNSVNYITAHDGFTLYDVVTYTQKLNGCSKIDPACCNDPNACDLKSGSDDNAGRNWCEEKHTDEQPHRKENGRCEDASNEALKRQMMRNLFTLLLLSNGTPMIYGGDELMRTLYGNNNPYGKSSDNEYNWLRWDDWQKDDEAVRMRDFVKNVIQIRKNFRASVAPKTYAHENLVWRGPQGEPDWSSKTIGMYYRQTGSTPSLFLMINMEAEKEQTFMFPEEGSWKVLLDTQVYFDDGIFGNDPSAGKRVTHNASAEGMGSAEGSYTMKPRTIVVVSKG